MFPVFRCDGFADPSDVETSIYLNALSFAEQTARWICVFIGLIPLSFLFAVSRFRYLPVFLSVFCPSLRIRFFPVSSVAFGVSSGFFLSDFCFPNLWASFRFSAGLFGFLLPRAFQFSFSVFESVFESAAFPLFALPDVTSVLSVYLPVIAFLPDSLSVSLRDFFQTFSSFI
jgi:hypothetical protein